MSKGATVQANPRGVWWGGRGGGAKLEPRRRHALNPPHDGVESVWVVKGEENGYGDGGVVGEAGGR